jgi:hypothetical protein
MPDPSGFADGPNVYSYAHGNPIGTMAPDGRRGRSIWNDDGSPKYDRLLSTSMSTRGPGGVVAAAR